MSEWVVGTGYFKVNVENAADKVNDDNEVGGSRIFNYLCDGMCIYMRLYITTEFN